MGGMSFDCYGEGATVKAAYNNAVNNAYYDYGHAGYTGTIAEKDGFVLFELPSPGVSADAVADAAMEAYSDVSRLTHLGYDETTATKIRDVYGDKWGPAVALPYGEGKWFFCGIASS